MRRHKKTSSKRKGRPGFQGRFDMKGRLMGGLVTGGTRGNVSRTSGHSYGSHGSAKSAALSSFFNYPKPVPKIGKTITGQSKFADLFGPKSVVRRV
jgi:hypothetical protein